MSTYLPKLQSLIVQARKNNFHGRLLTVDPGETTGVTQIWVHNDDTVELQRQQQLVTWPFEEAVRQFNHLLDRTFVDQVVFEAYHVYKWRLQEHSFSQVPTIQIIGALKTWCVHFRVPMAEQTAQTGKAFFTDARLKAMDMYFPGQPHARDSLRHAAQWLVFGSPTQK